MVRIFYVTGDHDYGGKTHVHGTWCAEFPGLLVQLLPHASANKCDVTGKQEIVASSHAMASVEEPFPRAAAPYKKQMVSPLNIHPSVIVYLSSSLHVPHFPLPPKTPQKPSTYDSSDAMGRKKIEKVESSTGGVVASAIPAWQESNITEEVIPSRALIACAPAAGQTIPNPDIS